MVHQIILLLFLLILWTQLQMFDNIKSLRLTKKPSGVPIATAMISSEGEVMDFLNPGT